ncbi:MAG TPA: class D sortase [Gemmatimonadaceae bacterium]|nr:class D sortase [Gemmatimonadaceae bacterium]
MTRRRIGFAFLIAGGLVTTFAGSKYVSGAAAQDRARREWEATAARAAFEGVTASALRGREVALVHGAAVARLWIPKIGLDEIILEGIDDDALNGGPGHFPGSPLPGEQGNSIVSAHRDRHFRELGRISVGDTVVTEAAGKKTRWVIARRQVVDKDRPVLFPSKTALLTLTTCWPIQYFGTAPDRLILTARPIG